MTLIERAVRTCREAGVTDVVVVLGHEAPLIIGAVAELRKRYRMRIRTAMSNDWFLGNGASLAAAEQYVQSSFFVMMCDHIVDPGFFQSLHAADDGVRAGAVVVDRELERVRDLPEATKTRIVGPYVTAIGKQLDDYDAVDTGVFLFRPTIFDALRDAARFERYTVSDAVQLLADRRDMGWADCRALDWFDVDTPDDRAYAEARLNRMPMLESRP